MVGGFLTNWQHQHNTLHCGYTNIDAMNEDISHLVSPLHFSPLNPFKKFTNSSIYMRSFFYGLMTLMCSNTKIKGLILCPTRELDQQIAKQLFKKTHTNYRSNTWQTY
jgi:hypothetical protein